MMVRAQDPTTDDAMLVEVTLTHSLPIAYQSQMYLPAAADIPAGTTIAVARGWAQSLFQAGYTVASPDSPDGSVPPASVGPSIISGARGVFRDGFASAIAQPKADTWLLANEKPTLRGAGGEGHIVEQGGDSQGSKYLRISMSPFVDRSTVSLTSREKFRLPLRTGWGVSISQRFAGQEVFFGMVEASDSDDSLINKLPAPVDQPIGTQISVTSNVATVMVTGHPFRGGDRVILIDNADHRLNVGPVQCTIVDKNTITVPMVLANGLYTAAGSVREADPASRANNAVGLLCETATVTNATFVARRNGSKYRLRNETIGPTNSLQANASAYTDALVATSVHEIHASMEECSYRSFAADSNGGMNGSNKWSQNIPDEDLDYRLHLRARNLEGMSMPVAQILTIAKTGSTTATVTCDRPHGLVINDRVGMYGVRDLTNFPNTGDMPVASVVSDTVFTVVVGPSATVTNAQGGAIWVNQGGVNSPGAMNFAIQGIARTGGVMQVTLNATAAGFVPGEFVHVWGLLDASGQYDGAYKVLRMTGSILEVEAAGPDFTTITTGGAVIRRTDVRVHFVRLLQHTRTPVEVIGGRGNNADSNNAVPVSGNVTITGTATVGAGALTAETTETTAALAANAVYASATRDIGSDTTRRSTRLRMMVRHLAGLTPGSLYLEQSVDNATWFETWRMPVPSDAAAIGHTFEASLQCRYYRLRFQNGATAQTVFALQTLRVFSEGAADDEKNLQFPLTVTALAANGTFAGPTLDLGLNHNWDEVRVPVFADQNGTVRIQHSRDGASWRSGSVQAFVAANGQQVTLIDKVVQRYVRAQYDNGATAQGLFNLDLALMSR